MNTAQGEGAPLCVDSRGDLYVGEVAWTFGVSKFGVQADAHTFQKFERY